MIAKTFNAQVQIICSCQHSKNCLQSVICAGENFNSNNFWMRRITDFFSLLHASHDPDPSLTQTQIRVGEEQRSIKLRRTNAPMPWRHRGGRGLGGTFAAAPPRRQRPGPRGSWEGTPGRVAEHGRRHQLCSGLNRLGGRNLRATESKSARWRGAVCVVWGWGKGSGS